MYFDELDLSDNILDALYDMRFDECTPIQEQCIPHILEGRDMLGIAQTGTGKTAAYLLPILSLLDDGGYAAGTYGAEHRATPFPEHTVHCVVMSPTRELAQQIDQAMEGFSYYLDHVSGVPVYGGNDGARYDQELRALRTGADIIIATPGRLISHLQMGNLDLSQCSFFVLDEADRMLDMGFSEDILKLAKELPPHCQTIMFSATMPDKINAFARTLLNDPVEVKIAVSKPAEKIDQTAYVCHEPQKLRIIEHIFRQGDLNRVIIFCSKKTKVKDIASKLRRMNINCGAMHSDLSQAERDEIMLNFKNGKVDVLVATDIVSRGIDIDDIMMVINYDVPHDKEDYVHRIGRTARAQRDGRAITLVCQEDIFYFMAIEEFLEKEVTKVPLPEGFDEGPAYVAEKRKTASRAARGRGRGRGRGKTSGKSSAKASDKSSGKTSGKHTNQQAAKHEAKPADKPSHKAENGEKGDVSKSKRSSRKPQQRRKNAGSTGSSEKSASPKPAES